VALAALMTGRIDVRNKVAVAVLSGGNVDPDLFSRLVAEARSSDVRAQRSLSRLCANQNRPPALCLSRLKRPSPG